MMTVYSLAAILQQSKFILNANESEEKVSERMERRKEGRSRDSVRYVDQREELPLHFSVVDFQDPILSVKICS